ncbi:putative ribonuclease H-like domain-containing protein [Tanacetum coccineum]
MTKRYVVPTGKDNLIVSAGRPNMVPAGRTIQNIQPQIITTISNNNSKFPYLKKDEYEVWTMKMEYWITNNDMNIWKVIQNGNILKRTGRDRDGRVFILPLTTVDEHITVQRESKARTTLLQSIHDDHVADFHYMDDARDIWNAVKARISESEGLHKGYDRMRKILSQLNKLKAKPDDEDINLKFLRGLPSSWSQVALTLKTKGGLELLSFDDLYYKLKTLEIDIKGYSTHSSSQSPSHSAFVSTTSTSKKMSYAESPSFSSSTTYSAPSSSKARSHSSGNVLQDVLHSLVAESEPEQQVAYEDFEQIDKLDLEEMDIKWQMAMLSVRVNKFEKKAGRKIEFDKKEAARFNKKAVRCYKCLQKGHFARECRAKGGNEKRYSSFKIQELGKKEADTKALITVDTLENWKEHESGDDEGFAPKEYGMVAGCGAACEEGAAEVYSLITGNGTDAAAGEFALMGMTSEDIFSIGTKSSTSGDSNSVSNDFVSCDNNDKSSEVNTNNFASSDSSVKSLEPKSNDSTSCASTSSVSTSESEAEIESNVGTPIKIPVLEPIWDNATRVTQSNQFVSQAVLLRSGKVSIPAARPNQVPAGRPKPVSTCRPKPVSTVKQNRPPPVHAGRRNSSSVTSGWWQSTARPMAHLPTPTSSYFQTSTPFGPHVYYNQMHYDGDGWATAVKPSAGCSWKSHRNKVYRVNLHTDAGDESIVYSGCSRSMTGNKERLDDFQPFKGGKELQQFNVFSVSQICDKNNRVLFTDTDCLVLSNDFKLPVESMKYLGLFGGLDSSDGSCNNGIEDGSCKQHKATYKAITVVSSISEPLQLLYMDLFGPTSIRSIDHKYYCLVITDDYSRFCWVFFLETKDETYPILKDFISLVENQLNKKVKAIRCDNGTEFKNAKLIELCGEKGIKRDYSNARTPQQNGVAKRKNRTLIEAARTMLADSKLPTMFWTESHDHLGKFDGKADEGYLVGYSASNRAYMVSRMMIQILTVHVQVILVPIYPSKTIHRKLMLKDTSDAHSNGVLVDTAEYIFQQEHARLKGKEQRATSNAEILGLGFAKDAEELQKRASAKTVPPGSIPVPTGNIPVPSGDTMVSPSDVSVPTGGVPVTTGSPTDSFVNDGPTTRFPSPSGLGNNEPSPGIFSSSSYDDEFGADLNNLASTVELCKREARSVAQALEDPSWVDAMQEEMQQFKFQNVWILVDLPKVARIEAIRLFLAFASYMGFMVYQMDVKSAFLYGSIDEEVYVTQSKGFVDPQYPNKVYRVVKALYGLHQAQGGGFFVYMDDIIFGSTKKAWCDEFEALMKGEFEMSAMGELIFFKDLMESLSAKTVSACSRNQVTPTTSNLEAVKKIFKYLKGQSKLGLWIESTTGGCQFWVGVNSMAMQEQTIWLPTSTEAEYVVL